MNTERVCNCNFAISGRCFLKVDDGWHKRNQKLIEHISQFGWYAFTQNETLRLREKGKWMGKLDVENINDIQCEKDKAE